MSKLRKGLGLVLIAAMFAVTLVSCDKPEDEVYAVDREEVERPGEQGVDPDEVERPGSQGGN